MSVTEIMVVIEIIGMKSMCRSFYPWQNISTCGVARTRYLRSVLRYALGQGLEISHDQLEILLSRGLVAFFFDGLDEIGSIVGRQRALEEINDLVAGYAVLGNRFGIDFATCGREGCATPWRAYKIITLGFDRLRN